MDVTKMHTYEAIEYENGDDSPSVSALHRDFFVQMQGFYVLRYMDPVEDVDALVAVRDEHEFEGLPVALDADRKSVMVWPLDPHITLNGDECWVLLGPFDVDDSLSTEDRLAYGKELGGVVMPKYAAHGLIVHGQEIYSDDNSF